MKPNEVLKSKIIPVIQMDDASKVRGLSKALTEGGLGIAEVTLRSANALDVVHEFSRNHPEITLGAGTVSSVDQVGACIDAGAEFIVSPGINPKVVKHCQNINIPIFPGVCTPTDIELALDLGLDILKFFPAEASGGLKMINALAGPYNEIKFIPTGGINENNIRDYISCTNVIACGGSWMAPPNLIREGKFDEILSLTRKAVKLAA